ncbi:MAG TPA: Coenzyme F420 hydrogenase/dehydrogenase, beta subunit C-terminal domain, partial [Steroidobacteraceae bacterium]|nr:Coenzyme F420 hydrogenase/dehydrogenase, beta subunit C-terminal domain [Steroidobacteraceae bacterium]
VENGLCIGCGLCESLAGSARIEVAMTDGGRERPIVRSAPDPAALRTIDAVCPGLQVRGADRRRLPPGVAVDPVWGPVARLGRCHARDPQVRFKAASGGVLSALAGFLLDSGRVELVLHVAASREAPMRSAAHVSFDRAQVIEGAGSRYGPAAALRGLCEILDGNRTFALIGKPCDVSAVRNLARSDQRVDERMRYALAFVCGGASTLGPSHDVLARFGIAEGELREFRYRGRGNPGPTALATADGRRFELTYDEMWSGDESSWQLQSRCKICPDAIGEAADLVAADAWPGGSPPAGGDDGFNAVIVRTRAGSELFDAAVAAGALTVCGPLALRELDDCNPHQVTRKKAVAARLAAVRAAGGRVPRVRGLRVARLALRNSPRRNIAEFRGALRRARSGRFGEPPARREQP